MNRLSAIDAPVTLGDLLGAGDLDEVVGSLARVHGVGVLVHDVGGDLRASAGPGVDALSGLDAHTVPEGRAAAPGTEGASLIAGALRLDGERIGSVIVGPYRAGLVSAEEVADGDVPHLGDERAREIGDHVTRMLGVLVHNAHARYLTATVHLASMDEAFAEMKEKNERLAVAIERMQEVDRLKTSFLATVSHELRTPLTSVIGYAEMLLEGLAGDMNDEQRDYVKTILAKADQLLQLITGILDASLIESGQMRLERQPVSLPDTVRRVISAFTSRAMKRRITVRGPGHGVPRAFGDPAKIRQVVWNLLANAIKFTPDGGEVSVDLAVGPLSPGDEAGRFGAPELPRSGGEAAEHYGLRMFVRDSGIGISAEKLAHIFEPFFQVDSSSTREYGGTGLGLTLAKSYVEAHGGHIWVDSKLGVGSTFAVTLPAVPDDLEEHLSECSTT